MKSQIKEGCAVKRIGDSEIGIVAFVDGIHARVDYISKSGRLVTAYTPVRLLELVAEPKADEKNAKNEP